MKEIKLQGEGPGQHLSNKRMEVESFIYNDEAFNETEILYV